MFSELEQLRRERDELVELLEMERAAVARYLIPHRRDMPECWRKHFSDECGVYFDAIGFVKPRPVVLQCNNEKPSSGLGWHYDGNTKELHCVFEVKDAATNEDGKLCPAGAKFTIAGIPSLASVESIQTLIQAFCDDPAQAGLKPGSLTPIAWQKYCDEYAA